jgi:hypothetical protein
MNIIGIDPGCAGGIAEVDELGLPSRFWKMPETDADLWAIMLALVRTETWPIKAFAMIELVRSSPQMGVVSAFTFGRGVGRLRMALTAAGIGFEEVSPAKWQREIGCLSKGDKNVTKAKAQELFPNIKITHAIADALLIAEYARRIYIRRNGL